MYGKAVVFFAALTAVSAGVINNGLIEADMPEECNGQNYCHVKSDKYPQGLIDSFIESLGDLYEDGEPIIPREGGDGRREDDCSRDTRFEPIYQIKDKNGAVRYVAQSDNKFLQKIRTESCKKPGRLNSSIIFTQSQLDTINFTCSEKRIEYSFLALSLDGSKLEDVDVYGGLPVCCSCVIQ